MTLDESAHKSDSVARNFSLRFHIFLWSKMRDKVSEQYYNLITKKGSNGVASKGVECRMKFQDEVENFKQFEFLMNLNFNVELMKTFEDLRLKTQTEFIVEPKLSKFLFWDEI